MPTRMLTFPGSAGTSLAGRLELPAEEPPRAYALFAHCFTCAKNLNAVVQVSRAMAAAGLATLRFDFTGLGESEGDFADTSFSSNVDDVVAAAEFLAREFEPPQVLAGHSLGGAAVIRAASRVPSARVIATIGAPADPADVLRHLRDDEQTIRREGEAEVELAGRRFRIRRQFLDDLAAVPMREAIRHLGRALVVCHSPADTIVDIRNAVEIFDVARHPKSFVSLDRADHLLSQRADSRYAGAVLAALAARYLDAAETTAAEPSDAEAWVVARTGASGYRTALDARRHRLAADEPRAVGGDDEGPTPYELLAAALGACTGMTLRMYADRKGWPLDEIVVRLKHSRIHADDERRCESDASRVDRLERRIHLVGGLDAAQQARLLEIADKCPVHRTLSSGVCVETSADP